MIWMFSTTVYYQHMLSWDNRCCFSVTDGEVHPGIKDMEAMILECAKLDREINYFVDVVKQVTSEVNKNNMAWSETHTIKKHVYTH